MNGMPSFDYNAPAELFVNNGGRRQRSMTCKRFDRAADAVRYVGEALPISNAASAVIEVDEIRYRYSDVINLYNASEYPLPRRL
jgi:hypothetical protein